MNTSSHSPDEPLRVLLADDHALVRSGLRLILELQPDIVVVGEAEDGAQALALAAELQPDLLLTDITMPPPDGIEVARRIAAELPGIKTVVVSMHEDSQIMREAMAAGASGYLIKRSIPSELTDAIRVVAAGGQYVAPGI